jgi:hypothetical protein
MRNQGEGDVLHADPDEFSLEELYDILAGRSDLLPPVIALSVLRRKEYPEDRKIADLQRILLDAQASSRLRTAAAVELSRLGTSAAQTALRESAEKEDEVIRRSVQIAERELARLRGRALPPRQERRAALPDLRTVMALEPGPTLPVEAKKARSISRRKTEPATAERIVGDLHAETPGLDLAVDITHTLRCAGRTLAFVATRDVARLLRQGERPVEPTVVGVVAMPETVETGKWSAHYFLLAGRSVNSGEVDLRLVTTAGQVFMVGTGTLIEGRAAFSLRSVAGPGNVPTEVSGNYRPGRMQWTEARSEMQVPRQLTPRPRG